MVAAEYGDEARHILLFIKQAAVSICCGKTIDGFPRLGDSFTNSLACQSTLIYQSQPRQPAHYRFQANA